MKQNKIESKAKTNRFCQNHRDSLCNCKWFQAGNKYLQIRKSHQFKDDLLMIHYRLVTDYNNMTIEY